MAKAAAPCVQDVQQHALSLAKAIQSGEALELEAVNATQAVLGRELYPLLKGTSLYAQTERGG